MQPEFPVLVPQAESLGAVAVIRSLGRAGYAVHATAPDAAALGLHSRLAAAAAVSPAYADPAYVQWARDYVRAHGIRAIVPSEGFLLAVRPALREFLPLFPLAPDEDTLLAALSKARLLEKLLAAGAPHLPKTLLVELPQLPAEAELARLGAPLYVKLDGCHARDGSRGSTHRLESAAAARELMAGLRGRFARALVQGHVEGQGVAAFFLVQGGEVLAQSMQRRLHEVPFTGGVSSLRETWQHPGILADALAKLRLSGWQGVAMMEYRWDPGTDRFAFLEMNARFWGSLHLSLLAGVDYPRLLLDAFRGKAWRAPLPRAACCRHLPLELQHLWSKLKSRRCTVAQKLRACVECVALTFHPAVRSDLLFPGDRALFFRALWQFFRSLRKGVQHEQEDRAVSRLQGARALFPGAPADAAQAAHPLLPRHRAAR